MVQQEGLADATEKWTAGQDGNRVALGQISVGVDNSEDWAVQGAMLRESLMPPGHPGPRERAGTSPLREKNYFLSVPRNGMVRLQQRTYYMVAGGG